jgi:hypothetical protein
VGSWAFGPLLLHRDATSWKPVPTPNLLGIGSLEAIDARGAGFDWAVGRQLLSGNTKTLAVSAPSRYSGAVDGQTSSNATVTWIGPENGTVDADQFGHFQAGGLNAGTYTFVASLQGCIPFSKTVAVVAGTTKAITLSPQC